MRMETLIIYKQLYIATLHLDMDTIMLCMGLHKHFTMIAFVNIGQFQENVNHGVGISKWV